jgi:hypothetical protein
MVRGLVTGALTLLLAAVLLWGGCAACSQLLAAKGASGCCDKAGKCETPDPAQADHHACVSAAPALQQYVSGDAAPAIPGQAPAYEASPAPLQAAGRAAVPPEPDSSPPDLFLRNSTLRI